MQRHEVMRGIGAEKQGGSVGAVGFGQQGVMPASAPNDGQRSRVLRTSELEYDLPEDRIAKEPVTPRDSARLMVVSRDDRRVRAHAAVRDLGTFLRAGDLLVFNTTRVLPARLVGEREDTGGKVEGLFLSSSHVAGEERWTVLLRAKQIRAGMRILLHDAAGKPGGVVLEALERHARETGGWVVRVHSEVAGEELERVGRTPLPPYILRARQHAHLRVPEASDREQYQTVYAKEPGSVAAPTAGLHFTPELLERLRAVGVERADVTLHVGTGTFKPIDAEVVEEHPMHSERCSMSGEAIRSVLHARTEGRRVIAVGTTSARALESYAIEHEKIGGGEIERLPESIETRILITPGYRWRWVSGMMTNFHLPRSTLLAMVGSFLGDGEGVPALLELYREAIGREYRFYSYGDAMLVA